MLRSFRRDADFVSAGIRAYVHGSFFDAPDPECEDGVQQRIDPDCDCGVQFCRLETQLVVPVKGGCADGKGGIPECEARVGENVGLLEGEGVEVGGDGVVGGIF